LRPLVSIFAFFFFNSAKGLLYFSEALEGICKLSEANRVPHKKFSPNQNPRKRNVLRGISAIMAFENELAIKRCTYARLNSVRGVAKPFVNVWPKLAPIFEEENLTYQIGGIF